MVFSSLTFIFLFLPLVSIFYNLIHNINYRNLVLLVLSLIFYAWGEPIYIVIMLFSTINDYIHAILIYKYSNSNKKYISKLLLFSSVSINLLLLGIFKYGDFIILNINNIFSISINSLNLALPIGISFYTFQTMSYTIDVYRNKVKPQYNFLYLATYVSMFPQLIAGPIVRYETIEKELIERTINLENISDGFRRFIIGLAKKLVLANHMAVIADKVIELPNYNINLLLSWLGIIAYALQIYYDFSGYSDMAIGLGKMLGFNFLENFDYPYTSRSITEFWRRWHISLGTWFRDYLYIPLGGNKLGRVIQLRNILITWAVTGLWHGASWNFVLWGTYYGIILIIEKFILKEFINKLPKIFSHLYSVILILFGWVLFRIEGLSNVLLYTNSMIGKNGIGSIIDFYNINVVYLFPYLIISILGVVPIIPYISSKMKKYTIYPAIHDTIVLAILMISIMSLVSNSFNPFIYFRF